ncbi:MAG: hypothetical protein RJB39_478 [Candidatus Parcubacteria bacterium]
MEDLIIVVIVRFFKFFKKGKGRLKKIFLIFLSLGMLVLAIFLIWFTSLKTPSLNAFDDKLLGQSAKIYDRTGTVLLYDLSQKVRRSVVPLEKISPYIVKATVAIEDKDFYSHSGIRVRSLLRAVFRNITDGGYSEGGSTITQQVIKNSLLTKDKLLSRKIKEIFLAIKLEKTTSKDEIMHLYLNNSPYGGNIYGVEEAAELFFGKHAADVTLAEAAVLASLPKAPSTYNPYGGKKDLLMERKNLVLKRMYEVGYITEEEMTTAQAETLVFQPRNLGSIKAAHFVMYLKEQLEEKYGAKKLEEGGFTVVSTINYEMQKKAEELVLEYVKKNQKRFGAENASVVVVDPKTGQILAMVGSRDYFDEDIDGNYNIATAKRQPGSSFKPFVYATAFNKGFTDKTVLFDTPTEFSSGCTPTGVPKEVDITCYNPQNYEGGFKGPMTVRNALGASRNIPAVKMAYLVGVNDVLDTAKAMGIEGLLGASNYGLSIALGAADVSLLDMTEAYAVFANDGIKNKPEGILKIEDNKGGLLYEFATSSKRVLPEQTARLMNSVLSDPRARNTIFVLSYFKNDVVAVKTGTTNNSRDAWMMGYTPTVAVGAWMGNNDNRPMNQLASALTVGPLWKSVMDDLLTKVPKESFVKPEEISSDTKPFMRGIYQTADGVAHSELYWVDIKDPTGSAPTNPEKDPSFYNWEASVYSGGEVVGSTTTVIPPGPGGIGPIGVSILGKRYYLSRNESIQTAVSGANTETLRIDYLINGVKVGESSNPPYSVNILLSSVPGLEPENELTIMEYRRSGGEPRVASTGFTIEN